MRAALLLLPLLRLADDAGEQFYKFPKDSVWTYSITAGPPDKTTKESMTFTVVGEADGKVSVDTVGTGERAHSTKMLWYVADGFFFWAERKEEGTKDAIALLKPGSKKGDTWTLQGKKGMPQQTGTHLGPDEVKVPAGVYKDALHTRIDLVEGETKFSVDVYLVEKVGVVKMTYNAKEMVMAFELESFKPAK